MIMSIKKESKTNKSNLTNFLFLIYHYFIIHYLLLFNHTKYFFFKYFCDDVVVFARV